MRRFCDKLYESYWIAAKMIAIYSLQSKHYGLSDYTVNFFIGRYILSQNWL